MKKLQLLLLVLILVAVSSCKKESSVKSSEPQYVKSIAGVFNVKDNNFKAAPVGSKRDMIVLKQTGTGSWSLVDGTEFFPGSFPQTDWLAWSINHNLSKVTDYNNLMDLSAIHITFCPIMPLRVITKTYTADKELAYLGISQFTPNAANFPYSITGRRLGDVLKVNKDALGIIGYDFVVTVKYTLSTIDEAQTVLTSPVTDSNWPELKYVAFQASDLKTKIIDAAGDVVVYEGLDAKVTGVIEITITDLKSKTSITKNIDAAGLGHGLLVTLKSANKGYYDSGNHTIEDKDIAVDPIEVNIDN